MNNHVALTRTLTATLLAGCHSAGAAAATVAGPSREVGRLGHENAVI